MREYSDPAIEAQLREAALSNGFNAWLGLRLIAAGAGQCEIEAEVTEAMRQHHGFAHGGVVGAVADVAASWATASQAGDVVTSSYTLHLMGPAREARLRARGAVIKQGKRAATAEAKVFTVDAEGGEKLIAVALASIALLAAA